MAQLGALALARRPRRRVPARDQGRGRTLPDRRDWRGRLQGDLHRAEDLQRRGDPDSLRPLAEEPSSTSTATTTPRRVGPSPAPSTPDRLRLRAQRASGRLARVRVQARLVSALEGRARGGGALRFAAPRLRRLQRRARAHRRLRPAKWAGHVLFNPDERAALRDSIDFGLVDSIRAKNDAPGLYTWWDYRMGQFRRNQGLRIDHALATQSLAEKCTSAIIDRRPRELDKPSDHAPVIVEFDLLINPLRPPRLLLPCSDLFREVLTRRD